jgi:protein-S-isoprenylcysteine O-methyltransferase Ste14
VTSAPHAPARLGRDPLALLGAALFRYRDALFPIVLIAAALGTRPRLAGTMRTDHLMDAIGFAVSAIGQAIRMLVVGLVYITRGGQNRQPWANSLVEGGIFGHARNPLYAANMIILLGLALVHNGWAMYLVVLPAFAFMYSAIVRAEEQYLSSRFGGVYDAYCQRVPRWIPRLRGVGTTILQGSFNWLKVLRKEYGTPFAWVSGFLLLLVWEHSSSGAAPMTRVERNSIVVVWVAMAVAYTIVRRLKLANRLGTD